MANGKRLIDADLLLQWVEKLEAYNMGRISSLKKPKGLTPEGVRHMIDTMPKVDAVEVVHGRWIFKHNPITDPKKYFIRIVCSECNLHTGQKSNYCPNCGAKMDGGNEDGIAKD